MMDCRNSVEEEAMRVMASTRREVNKKFGSGNGR
jgi:hypothetical protein